MGKQKHINIEKTNIRKITSTLTEFNIKVFQGCVLYIALKQFSQNSNKI